VPINVTCTHCGKTYALPESRAGQTGKCTCGQLIKVPALAAPPPAPGPVPPPPPFPPAPRGGPVVEEEAPEAGGPRCPSCGMVTRQGRVCEWCNATLAAPAPPPPAVPPPPPSPMSEARAGMADGALVQYVAPGPFIKNLAVLSVVYVAVTNGLAFGLQGLLSGRSPLGFMPFMGGASALNVVIGIVASILSVCLTVVIFNWVAGWGSGFPVRFRAPAPWASGTRELRRIGPVSAMVTGALVGAVGGLLLGLLMLVAVAVLASVSGGAYGSAGMTVVAAMLLGVPLGSGVWMGLVALGLSALYNVLAPAWGGIQFQSAIASTAHGVPGADGPPRASGVGAWQTGVIVAAEALVFAVFGVVIALVGMSGLRSAGMGPMAGAGSAVMVVAMLVIYPVLGFISGAVTALIYNLAGLIAGGVEIEAV